MSCASRTFDKIRSVVKCQVSTVKCQSSAVPKSNGFSLIELLVVIVIISILIGAASVSYAKTQQKSRDARRKTDLKAIQQALEQYHTKNNTYPTLNGSGSDTSLSQTTWSDPTNINGLAYYLVGQGHISQLPIDPKNKLEAVAVNSTFYGYYPTVANGVAITYELCANLENDNDPERTVFCSNGVSDYKMTNP